MSEKLSDVVKAHFIGEDSVPLLPEEQFYEAHLHHERVKRQLVSVPNDTSSLEEGEYGEWTQFGECSVKCGGGFQVRMRECLRGNCTELGPYTESRECGFLPCVAGVFFFFFLQHYFESLCSCDSNGIRKHNHLIRKRTLNHLARLA